MALDLLDDVVDGAVAGVCAAQGTVVVDNATTVNKLKSTALERKRKLGSTNSWFWGVDIAVRGFPRGEKENAARAHERRPLPRIVADGANVLRQCAIWSINAGSAKLPRSCRRSHFVRAARRRRLVDGTH